MALSKNNIEPILLDLNQDIEECAESSIQDIFERPESAASFYPPNGGLTIAETAELQKLNDNEDLRSALRKVLADNAGNVVFQLLSVLDGVADPKNATADFSDVRLQDQDPSLSGIEFQDMLHDSFLEHYWSWESRRPVKSWKLDNYNP